LPGRLLHCLLPAEPVPALVIVHVLGPVRCVLASDCTSGRAYFCDNAVHVDAAAVAVACAQVAAAAGLSRAAGLGGAIGASLRVGGSLSQRDVVSVKNSDGR
jgi:hypothetical protein